MNVHLFFAFLASAAAAAQTPANPGQQVSSTQPAGVRRGAGDGANISESHSASALGRELAAEADLAVDAPPAHSTHSAERCAPRGRAPAACCVPR